MGGSVPSFTTFCGADAGRPHSAAAAAAAVSAADLSEAGAALPTQAYELPPATSTNTADVSSSVFSSGRALTSSAADTAPPGRERNRRGAAAASAASSAPPSSALATGAFSGAPV